VGSAHHAHSHSRIAQWAVTGYWLPCWLLLGLPSLSLWLLLALVFFALALFCYL
jgi:hypothetical protein